MAGLFCVSESIKDAHFEQPPALHWAEDVPQRQAGGGAARPTSWGVAHLRIEARAPFSWQDYHSIKKTLGPDVRADLSNSPLGQEAEIFRIQYSVFIIQYSVFTQ